MFIHLSLIWAIVALVLLVISWRFAVAGKTKYHKRLMIFLTAGGWLFIAGYILQYQSSGRPTELSPGLIPWLALHGTIGLLSLLGASMLVSARLWQARHPLSHLHINRHHKLYGRILVVFWMFTHMGGIVNYWLFG